MQFLLTATNLFCFQLHIFASLSIQCVVLAMLTQTLNCILIEGMVFNHKCLFCKSNHQSSDTNTTYVSVLRLVLCAPVHLLGGPFIRKYAIKEENYKKYPGLGSQNLNANFNICLALFLGLFDCVLSTLEKSGCEVLSTQHSHVPYTHGSTRYEWDKTPILPPVSTFTSGQNPSVSVHTTVYSVVKGPYL
jgi:hypothetical protein